MKFILYLCTFQLLSSKASALESPELICDNMFRNRGFIRAVFLIVAFCFVVGIALLFYGIVHVSNDESQIIPIINSMKSLQSLQVPLLVAEHGTHCVRFDLFCLTMMCCVILTMMHTAVVCILCSCISS